jgi:hypothetical protein
MTAAAATMPATANSWMVSFLIESPDRLDRTPQAR